VPQNSERTPKSEVVEDFDCSVCTELPSEIYPEAELDGAALSKEAHDSPFGCLFHFDPPVTRNL